MGANKVRFTKEELKEALEPPLLKMYNCEPEAIPFRVPVDPKQLNIPDYFEIIKKPMDMSAIKNKLETGCYADPWEFVDDVWLMFENAWIYNRKTSRVYKYCTKVSFWFPYFGAKRWKERYKNQSFSSFSCRRYLNKKLIR